MCGGPVLHRPWSSGVQNDIVVAIPDVLWQQEGGPMNAAELTRLLCIYEHSHKRNSSFLILMLNSSPSSIIRNVIFQKFSIFYARICSQSRISHTSCITTNGYLKIVHHQSSYQRTNLLKSHCVPGSVPWGFQGCQLPIDRYVGEIFWFIKCFILNRWFFFFWSVLVLHKSLNNSATAALRSND